MTDEKMEPQRRVYISLPKKHRTALAEKCKLDHGLVIKDLSTNINEGYLQAYFRQWGSITACTIKKTPQDSDSKSASEADTADWAGPHYIGGMEVEAKRVVSLKVNQNRVEVIPARSIRRRDYGSVHQLSISSRMYQRPDDNVPT
uniref:Uncharacterized protein n=1 Tax=Oncorhynchus tshawytscha TaxID=74940 RepID=A0A8C8IMC4_ONCTS